MIRELCLYGSWNWSWSLHSSLVGVVGICKIELDSVLMKREGGTELD